MNRPQGDEPRESGPTEEEILEGLEAAGTIRFEDRVLDLPVPVFRKMAELARLRPEPPAGSKAGADPA